MIDDAGFIAGRGDSTMSMTDTRAELERAIATGLADLSTSELAPKDEVDLGAPFDSEAITFSDGSWLEYLGRVQDWLRLERELPLEPSSYFIAVVALFKWLGVGDPSAAFVVENDVLLLTDQGLELIMERVEQALALRDAFIEDCEELDQIVATERWLAAWEDQESELSSDPVIAKADVWPIGDFVTKAVRGQLNLNPSYQRADVWPTKDAELLMESILRGIPLPSVVLLRQAESDGSSAHYEVVDGKQRLTSILRFVGKHPAALEAVEKAAAAHPQHNLKSLFEHDYPRFRTAWKNAVGEAVTATIERERYFPFRLRNRTSALRGPLEGLRDKYYCQIKDNLVTAGGETVSVRDLFEAMVAYRIPLIEYSQATPRQIHDVFHLYNRQGKHLNAEEIRNAIFQDVDLMRALSVAAGDNPNLDLVAPFLAPIEPSVRNISTLLDDYNFGDARYRRTKVLSWLFSMLFVDPIKDGALRRLSTAKQIDTLLESTKDRAIGQPLSEPDAILRAMLLVERSLDAHQSLGDGWAPRFRNATGSRWQELQLVASLLGVAMCSAVLGEELKAALFRSEDEIHDRSLGEWRRPKKTQTGVQWDYIAKVALGITNELGVELPEIDAALKSAFKCSPIAGLKVVLAESE
jgi:hypothetical protein